MTSYRNALVTGASSGIGEQFARQLAAQGADLVLVARRTDRLQALAAELQDAHGVHVQAVTADLAVPADLATVEKLAGEVDLLVNNAGVGSGGAFHRIDPDAEENVIRVNVIALVRLAHAAAAAMVERGAGGIVNVSSVAGEHALPGNATYSASKAFVTSFSEAIAVELARHGVIVTTVVPGFTRTDMPGDLKLPSWMWLQPEAVAREALRAVEAGRTVVTPGAQYKLISALIQATPRPVRRVVSRRLPS